ncbi:MAG: hypothetical protein NTV22_11310 [bacterium]|nr:hypothetical protein [bacterium]
MAQGLSITAQAEAISARINRTLKAASVRALNDGAWHLRNLSVKAAETKKGAHREGKRLWQSIKVESATAQTMRSLVYLDTSASGVPHAAAVHENRHGYNGLTNRSGGSFMFVPIHALANKHKLHAQDAEQRGLRGWMVNGAKSRPVGAWSKQDLRDRAAGKEVVVHYLLKRSVDIPRNDRCGFLTDTARNKWREIQGVMRNTVWDVVKALMSQMTGARR